VAVLDVSTGVQLLQPRATGGRHALGYRPQGLHETLLSQTHSDLDRRTQTQTDTQTGRLRRRRHLAAQEQQLLIQLAQAHQQYNTLPGQEEQL
jgi:hypothetical protein